MGELITTIRFGGKGHRINPVTRGLLQGGKSLNLRQVCERTGGLILGEGDTGKSTYSSMLKSAAEKKGPSEIIRLRQRKLDFVVPALKEGETATIIFDGLDEFPECVRDIIDFAEALDDEKYHIWVTSRAGDAASRLCESTRFEDIYRLAAFTHEDVKKIAKSAGINGDIFIDRVLSLHLESFLAKPGGTVLLLQLFANDKLKASSKVELMEEIARAFARETRDGHTLTEDSDEAATDVLIEAASWMSTCLVLSKSAAIWTGASTECPSGDLLLSDIPLLDFTREIFATALKRRLFEPLTAERYRISYTEMPLFLVGHYLAGNLLVEKIEELYPYGPTAYEDQLKIIAWASCYEPNFGAPFVSSYPEAFYCSSKVIENFGIDRYFKLLLRTLKSQNQNISLREYMKTKASELSGFEEFADYLIKVIEEGDLSGKETSFAFVLLAGCRTSPIREARVIIDWLSHAPEGWIPRYYAALRLRDLMRLNTEMDLETLRDLYEEAKSSNDSLGAEIADILSPVLDPKAPRLIKETPPPIRRNDEPEELLTESKVKELLSDMPEESFVHYDDETERRREERREILEQFELFGKYEDDIDETEIGYEDEEDEEEDISAYQSEGNYVLDEIFEHQDFRGLKYRALENYFEETINIDSASALENPRRLLYAIAYNPVRYAEVLRRNLDKEPNQTQAFFKWVEEFDKSRRLREAVKNFTIDQALDIFIYICIADIKTYIIGSLYDRILKEPSEKVISELEHADRLLKPIPVAPESFQEVYDDNWMVEEPRTIKIEESRNHSEITRLLDEISMFFDEEEASFETPIKRLEQIFSKPKIDFAKKVAEQVTEKVVEVFTNKGGRPKKSNFKTGYLTQGEVAAMFGPPCTAEKVANWEAKARGAKRGSNPPTAIIKGERYHYSEDLRINRTAENINILAAIILDYKSRHAIKQNAKDKPKEVHAKSEETLARMRGVAQSESRKLHQNP